MNTRVAVGISKFCKWGPTNLLRSSRKVVEGLTDHTLEVLGAPQKVCYSEFRDWTNKKVAVELALRANFDLLENLCQKEKEFVNLSLKIKHNFLHNCYTVEYSLIKVCRYLFCMIL